MPLTAKGQKIMANMQREYGPDKGERVFYASRNAGRISGVDPGHRYGGVVKLQTGGPADWWNQFDPRWGSAGWLQANPRMNFNDWVAADQGALLGQSYGGLPAAGPAPAAAGASTPAAAPTAAPAVSFNPRMMAGARGGAVYAEGGVVDHGRDPDLPPLQDDATLHDMLERQPEPAYIATMRRLVEQQQRLNTLPLHPVERELLRRYWLGGYVPGYWLGGWVG